MSRNISFTLPMVELKSRSGQSIVTPLGFGDTCQFGLTAQKAAEHFHRAAQKHLLQQGQSLDFMQQLQPHACQLDSFEIEIVAAPKGDGFDPQCIKFDYAHWSTPSHTLGIVPVLGVGGAATSLDGLIEQLRESVKLYLFKTGRSRSLKHLLALQWFGRPEIKPIEIEAVFHTPKELDSLHQGEANPLLPRTARQMITPALPALGMEAQVEELQRSLRGEFRQSVMILGPPGSGKSALIGEYIRTAGLPHAERPWRTSAARMLQVLTESGGWQYQLGLWCREVREAGAVVNMGPMYELFEVGQYSGNDISIAESLRDPLQRGELTLICEATVEQLDRMERRSPGYGDLFVKIDLGERKPEEQDRIILQATARMSGKYKVKLDEGTVLKLVALQRRYSPYSGFPGKSIRFLESLLITARDHSAKQEAKRKQLTEQDIIAAYCQESGLPDFLVDDRVRLDSDALGRFFDDAIIGQTRAKSAVRETLLAVKAGLHQIGRPIAGFLFVGPTGTGKTALSKTLARYLFGAEDRMLRFDMSEYSDPWSVSRLTQTSEASLVTKVRQVPFSVLLFDEIEKADPGFYDLLLQILGEGRLSDDRGEVANFCSCIIIMTSNIGASDYMRPSMTFAGRPDNEGEVIAHFENSVKQHFRPELYNRIDQVVPFSALGMEDRSEVIRLELASLLRKLRLLGQNHSLEFDDRLYAYLAALPLNGRYGARAIQRLLDRHIIHPLSRELAAVRDHPQRIAIGVSDNGILFEVNPADESKRSGNAIQQIADALSTCRRSLQRMEESVRWLGLLSRLDRVESYRRRHEKRFWSDPHQVNLQQTLATFVDKQRQLLQKALLAEEQTVSQLLSVGKPLLEQASHNSLDDLLQERQHHFTELLAYLEPQLNSALLLIHGIDPYLSTWAKHYRQFLDDLDAAPKPVYLYRRQQRESPPLTELIRDINHQEQEECYQLYGREHPRLGKPSALGFQVQRPCIAKLLQHEAGIVSHVIDGGKDAKLLVELFSDEIGAYRPPEAIYRKKFYDKKKSQRRIRDPYLLELLDSHGAVIRTQSWKAYMQQRVEQAEAAIVVALTQEDPA